ncbi:hypothetical protein ABTC63_21980, partial [Acinetobacter baumannii]
GKLNAEFVDGPAKSVSDADAIGNPCLWLTGNGQGATATGCNYAPRKLDQAARQSSGGPFFGAAHLDFRR